MVSLVHAGILATLRQLARSYTTSPLPEWDEFARSTRLETVEAKDRLPAGPHDIYVVVRGLVKLIQTNDEGTERVEEFFEAIAMVAPGLRPQWASNSAAPLSITRWRARNWSVPLLGALAVERTTVLRLDYRVVQQLAAKHPAWGEVHSAFLWTYVDGLFSITNSVREGSVEDRYRNLLRQRPSLMRRVSQRDIASYLSITESALSRIAKRVRDAELDPDPV